MAQLRQDFVEFEKRETTILVIGPEQTASFIDYFKKHALPFIGIPDPEHTVLERYGQEINLFKLGRMPAQVLVDKNGIARYVHYGHDMTDIPQNTELLALIDRLNAGG